MSRGKAQPRSLIVRIYRHGYKTMSGIAEDPQTGAQQPFSSVEGLWEAMSATIRRTPRVRKTLKTIT